MISTLAIVAVSALATSAYVQDAIAVPLGDEYCTMKAYSEGTAGLAGMDTSRDSNALRAAFACDVV
jgi:hypothetical protein